MVKELKSILIERIRQDYSSDASEMNEKIETITRAQNIREIGLDIQDAIEILKQNGIPIILTEEDKEILKIDSIWKPIKGTEDLLLVHKTDLAPTGSKVVTPSESGNKYLDGDITINGQEMQFKYKQERYVVNFAVNHEVSGNDGGFWGNCRYTVIIPWNSIPDEKIVGGIPVDVFTDRQC